MLISKDMVIHKTTIHTMIFTMLYTMLYIRNNYFNIPWFTPLPHIHYITNDSYVTNIDLSIFLVYIFINYFI